MLPGLPGFYPVLATDRSLKQRIAGRPLGTEIENRLHEVAVERGQACHRFDHIVKSQPQMPLARKIPASRFADDQATAASAGRSSEDSP
jgi:hypothetical protein